MYTNKPKQLKKGAERDKRQRDKTDSEEDEEDYSDDEDEDSLLQGGQKLFADLPSKTRATAPERHLKRHLKETPLCSIGLFYSWLYKKLDRLEKTYVILKGHFQSSKNQTLIIQDRFEDAMGLFLSKL